MKILEKIASFFTWVWSLLFWGYVALVAVMMVAFCLTIFAMAAWFGVEQIQQGETTNGVLIIIGGALFSSLALYGFFTDIPLRTRLGAVAPTLKSSMPSNQGDTPNAFFITTHGSATGYHVTDKLTPDGILCGFQHDDFAPGFVQSYGVTLSREIVHHVFSVISSEAFQSLPGNIQDPRIHDGFVLKITTRLQGREKVIWLSNVSHPILSPLVAMLWKSAPESHRREFPNLPLAV